MSIAVYNQKGEKVEDIELPKEIFDVKLNSDLVRQVAVSQMSNRRERIAHTKNRGEVRGGGRKPWPQKHTGRARHGSIRSPLWRHGGITFGPRSEINFKKKIPTKMRRKALFMVISAKARNDFLIILDKLKLDAPKTKLMAQVIGELKAKIENFKRGSILIALPGLDKNLILATRNLPNARVLQAKDLNTLDLLSYKYIITPKDSIKVIQETFGR